MSEPPAGWEHVGDGPEMKPLPCRWSEARQRWEHEIEPGVSALPCNHPVEHPGHRAVVDEIIARTDDGNGNFTMSSAEFALVKRETDRAALLAVAARLPVGTHVVKPLGYPYPGTVVAAFTNLAGDPRLVVESDLAPGMLHIFTPTQVIAD